MQPQIQYCTTSDDIKIALCAFGQGPPLVSMPWICASHIAMEWEIPQLRQQYEFMAKFRTLVRYDNRGFGMSDRGVADFSTRALAGDLETVAAHLSLERFQLMATGVAAPVALVYAARHPDQVSHLVLREAFARGSDVWSEPFEDLASLADKDWELASEAFVNATWQVDRDFSQRLAALMRQSVTPATLLLFLAAVKQWDVSDLLASIRTRTLIVNERTSRYVGPEAAQKLAGAIPGARLLLMDGARDTGTQVAAFLSDGDDRRVELPRTAAEPEAASVVPALSDLMGIDVAQVNPSPAPTQETQGTSTILFADVVDSTAMQGRFGNAVFRERTRQLESALRAAISRAGGTPVEGRTLGDGVIGVFTSAAQAIDAALQCGPHADRVGLQLHLGIHAGDVIHQSGDVSGMAVSVAARISDLTAPSEILVSGTVRDLARASTDVTFEDRGERMLKGIDDPVRVFAVRARE
jgi:class 3 adenylate cyclase/pimeloyl-ACP methyl ester carboxylesterase